MYGCLRAGSGLVCLKVNELSDMGNECVHMEVCESVSGFHGEA